MAHKLLVTKGWLLILIGLVLFLIVGPVTFMYFQPFDPELVTHRRIPEWIIAYYRMSVGSGIGAIGIFLIIFGILYLSATAILERIRKKRREPTKF